MRPLVWFRADLRTADNSALSCAAAEATRGVIGVFVTCPKQWREHDWADVKVDFLLRTLDSLSRELWKRKIPLLVGNAGAFDEVPDLLLDLAQRHECDALLFNREYEVNEQARDRAVTRQFEDAGLDVRAFTDQVILPPGSIRTGKGDFYTVFTPFRKRWTALVREGGAPKPLPAPRRQDDAPLEPASVPDRVDGFDPKRGVADVWPAGEDEAKRRLRAFVRGPIDRYATDRDVPSVEGTSTLSPYLAVGAISPRQCLDAACAADSRALDGASSGASSGASTWVSELIWREFYRHVLVGYPRVCRHRPFKVETDRIRWRRDEEDFAAWCEGRTGVPIVDAAMRQLLDIGWMHNRLRMITAMYLTKDLLIDWRWGERHFMRYLVDGDLASNNGGWQWSASTGTDAAPYFRIFNPVTQGERFDPEGVFVRMYVPELADLPAREIHDPADRSDSLLGGVDYPPPLVDRTKARYRALKAFKSIEKGKRS